MASWKTTLNIAPEWQSRKSDEITIHQLAAVVATKIRSLSVVRREDNADDVLMNFDDLADGTGDVEDFDIAMDMLYDWADSNRVWVNTI